MRVRPSRALNGDVHSRMIGTSWSFGRGGWMARRHALLAIFSLCVVGLAQAQSTLGQVLDRGGTRITEPQWRTLLPHTRFNWRQQFGRFIWKIQC
jgi:hypothetical protein